MPIYEFYCSDCHAIYNFFSHTVNTTKRPKCPKCGKKKLNREISRFATLRKSGEDGDSEMDDLPIDEAKMEQAMMALAGEAEKLDEDDPRAAAQLMRKMSDMTGLKFNESMEEALARLESGEDPDQIEQELGDIMEGDELPFEMKNAKAIKNQFMPPARDDTLYDL